MESSRTNKYRYDVGLMPVAASASIKLDFVNVDSMPEQRGKEHFFRTDFSLDIVDDRHRRYCTRKMAISAQPDTKGLRGAFG